MMPSMRTTILAAVAALALAGCRADREAAEPVDMSPDPRIQQAPAYPTPPGEVPTGVQPAEPGQPGGTVPADTLPGGVRTDPTGAGALPANRP
jgi:hypothetical protein